MKPVYRLAFLLSGAFALGILAGNGVNLHRGNAYSFITPGEKQDNSQPGYRGLIPGYTPKQAEDDQSPPRNADGTPGAAPVRPNFIVPSRPTAAPRAEAPITVDPNYIPPRKISTIEDINMVGLTKPIKIDWQSANVPPEIEQTISGMFTPRDMETLAKPRFRIDGMLPEEHSTKTTIDSMLAIVNDPAIPLEQRKANARKATEKLREYGYSLQTRANLPEAIFKKMGVPDSYLREEKESMNKSLDRVDTALRALKKYE